MGYSSIQEYVSRKVRGDQTLKWKLLFLDMSILIMMSSFLYSPHVKASSLNKMENEKIKVQTERISVENNIQNTDKLITKLQFDQSSLQAQMNRLETGIQENNQKYLEVKENMKLASIASNLTSTEINSLKENMRKRNELIKKRVQALQESNGQEGYLEIMFGSTGVEDFFNRINVIATIIDADRQMIEQTKKDQEALKEKRLSINKGISDLNRQDQELQGIMDVIQEQKKQKYLVAQQLKEKEKNAQEEKRLLQKELTTLTAKETALGIVLKQNEVLQAEKKDYSTQIPDLNGSIVNPTMVPTQYLPYYVAAEKEYGVPWYILASIHYTETKYSTHPTMISSAGAVGDFQFMPSTWVGSKYDIGGGLVSPDLDITSLGVIQAGHGYGTDGDHDGVADPFNFKDSLASAAKYLARNGFSKDPAKAIWHYNHASWYVRDVLDTAQMIKMNATNLLNPSDRNIVTIGNKWIDNSTYVFGAGRNQSDIENGKFDCSSFVHWAFKEVGIDLGPLDSVSTETLKNEGQNVSINNIKPGDLVFFDTYKKDGHVGIYVGNQKFIGAQGSTGVAIADMSEGYWKEKFNGRVKRVLY